MFNMMGGRLIGIYILNVH